MTGDSDKDSRGSSNNGDLPRPEAPQGATGQNPNSPETSETRASWGERLLSGIENPGNLEALTVKVGTLGLQGQKKNRSGAAKKRARKARLAEAPTGDSTGGQPPLQGGQKHTLQGPVLLGSKVKDVRKHWSRGMVHLGPALKRLDSLNRVLANARDPRALHQRVGR